MHGRSLQHQRKITQQPIENTCFRGKDKKVVGFDFAIAQRDDYLHTIPYI